MKKALLIALLAMMLISMLITACKPKVEEPQEEVVPAEQVAPAPVDTAAAAMPAEVPATPAPAGK